MHDGESITCLKFINLHKKFRQNLRQQICRKALFASILSDPDQNSGSPTSFDIWSRIANEAIIVFGLGTYDEYSTRWQQST